MKLLRRISTRQLLTLCASVAILVVGVAVVATAMTGGGPKPPPKKLPVAIHNALSAPKVAGVTARVQLTNNLVSDGDVQGSDPLLSGGSGRLWASADGRLRLELQSDLSNHGAVGDSQVLVNGRHVTAYDSASNTAYEATLPKHRAGHGNDSKAIPSVARIKRALGRVAKHAFLSGAIPSDVAGQPAYTVRVSPKRNSGLLGGVQLAWDAAHGTPLRAAVYAKGTSSPVLQLEATDISFGPVSSSVFQVSPPASAKVTEVSPPKRARASRGHAAEVSGLAAVARRTSFRPAAPRSLAGMRRGGLHLVGHGRDTGALVTYGRGLGGLAVLEMPAKPGSSGRLQSASGDGEGPGLTLPSVSVNGASGQELDTALGTLVRFRRAGVDYTVAGSVGPPVARAAARGL
jgi:outer membrane lipoprotein-sorting protein